MLTFHIFFEQEVKNHDEYNAFRVNFNLILSNNKISSFTIDRCYIIVRVKMIYYCAACPLSSKKKKIYYCIVK